MFQLAKRKSTNAKYAGKFVGTKVIRYKEVKNNFCYSEASTIKMLFINFKIFVQNILWSVALLFYLHLNISDFVFLF